MAVIEIEFQQSAFQSLTVLLLSAAPNPLPTVQALGPSRLISKLAWADDVTFGPSFPGFNVPPGSLAARSTLKIKHVSTAELDADPGAQGGTADAVAWLLVTAETSPPRLAVRLLGLDVAGGVPQRFNPPLEVGLRAIAELGAAADPIAAAVFAESSIMTLRFVSSNEDNLFAPRLNLLLGNADRDDNWLIRISPEVFTTTVLTAMNDGLNPRPAGTSIEDWPEAAWEEHEGTWRVTGSVGVEKEDACPGLLGDVDMSVTIDVTFTPTANFALETLDLALKFESNASDWDTLRCWLGSLGGLLSLGLAFVSLPVGFFAGVGTLIYAAEKVKKLAGGELADTDAGPLFHKVGSDDTSVTYAGQLPLPALEGIDQERSGTGPHGLVVTGRQFIMPADRVVDYFPDTANLKTRWHHSYDCKQGWSASLLIEGVTLHDTANTGPQEYAKVPITVFSTSSVEPAARWKIEPVGPANIEQYVRVSHRPNAFDLKLGLDGGAPGARLYLHTSAGIRRYDVDPIPVVVEPSAGETAVAVLNCKNFGRRWTKLEELRWLVDPPEWDLGLSPLRQWLLTVSEVPEGATLTLLRQRAGQTLGAPIFVRADKTASLALELITDAETHLALQHTLNVAPEARLRQRWLMPQRILPLGGSARQIARDKNRLAIVTAHGVLTMDLKTGRQRQRAANIARLEKRDGDLYAVENYSYKIGELSGVTSVLGSTAPHAQEPAQVPPFSVTLRDGRIVGAWGDKLVIARVWGDVAR
jgi:hypothetical protein